MLIEMEIFFMDVNHPNSSILTPEKAVKSPKSTITAISPNESKDKDAALRRLLAPYIDGRTSLIEIIWENSNYSEKDILEFATRSGISILHLPKYDDKISLKE